MLTDSGMSGRRSFLGGRAGLDVGEKLGKTCCGNHVISFEQAIVSPNLIQALRVAPDEVGHLGAFTKTPITKGFPAISLTLAIAQTCQSRGSFGPGANFALFRALNRNRFELEPAHPSRGERPKRSLATKLLRFCSPSFDLPRSLAPNGSALLARTDEFVP